MKSLFPYLLLSFCLAGMADPLQAVEVYQWTDENGVVHFSQWAPGESQENVETVRVEGGQGGERLLVYDRIGTAPFEHLEVLVGDHQHASAGAEQVLAGIAVSVMSVSPFSLDSASRASKSLTPLAGSLAFNQSSNLALLSLVN